VVLENCGQMKRKVSGMSWGCRELRADEEEIFWEEMGRRIYRSGELLVRLFRQALL
jgi:hypothetical protein